jgi:hypothetical protein
MRKAEERNAATRDRPEIEHRAARAVQRTSGAKMMLKESYALIMDSDRNPLRSLPKMVRFQYMTVLAYMWSLVFCLYIGATALIGPSIAVHTILLIGVFFTADIFRRARARARLAQIGVGL